MTDRDLSRIWWRLIVPGAVLVFAATLPSMFAADQPPIPGIVFTGKDVFDIPAESNTSAERVDSVIMSKPAQTVAERNLSPWRIKLFDGEPWGKETQASFMGYLLASGADIGTTHAKAGKGNCRESNPVNGNGNLGRTVLVSAVGTAVVAWVVDQMRDKDRWMVWTGGAIIRGGVAWHNSRVKC